MLQYLVWTGLTNAGLGASLQVSVGADVDVDVYKDERVEVG